jgi:hypothetical protein
MEISSLDIRNLLPSYLLVSVDTVRIENEILGIAKHFNPADVFYVKRQDGKKEIVVEDIENLIRQMQYGSVGDKKLFIIFNAELMNTQSQNKLLKTIEDTINSTVFFLCATDNTILPTIKSRSVIIYPQVAGENQTLLQLYRGSDDGKAIYEYADKLINACKKLDDTLTYLPTLTKPENTPLVFDAISKSIKKSAFPPAKKHKLYVILSNINRNILSNCNPTNAFDLLLIELFTPTSK